MSRLTHRFNTLHTEHRAALIPFITAGDPSPAWTVPLMHALVQAGADILELGVPFSDPMADGPVIQRASERALAAGTTLPTVLNLVKTFREQDPHTPVVLMGYLNPIEIMGHSEFVRSATAAEIDGVLTVDLPPEEASELSQLLRSHAIDPIFLLAPTTTPERLKRISTQASGYLYYVSLKGVTGSANLDVTTVANKLTEIRQHTTLPIGVGFGIKDAQTAAKVAKISDAVIVGSAIVQRIETEPQDRLLTTIPAFLRELRQAMNAE